MARHPGGGALRHLQLGDPALGCLAGLVDLVPHPGELRAGAVDLHPAAGEANDDEPEGEADDAEGGQLESFQDAHVRRRGEKVDEEDRAEGGRGDDHPGPRLHREGREDEGKDREGDRDVHAGKPDRCRDVHDRDDDGDERPPGAQQPLSWIAKEGVAHEVRGAHGARRGAVPCLAGGTVRPRRLRSVRHGRSIPLLVRPRAGAEVTAQDARSYQRAAGVPGAAACSLLRPQARRRRTARTIASIDSAMIAPTASKATSRRVASRPVTNAWCTSSLTA